MITPIGAFEIYGYNAFENIMIYETFAPGANAQFSIIFLKVFKHIYYMFHVFFQCCLKIENENLI